MAERKCVLCDAPAIGAVNEQSFCTEHLDEVIRRTVTPLVQAIKRAAPTTGTNVPNEGENA